MKNELSEGQFVRSKAGRDKGTLFLVVGIADEEHVYIADGACRKMKAPKRKKNKHLQKHNAVSDAVKEMLESGEKIEDALIRREIAQHQ